jgi:hypothetical protein
MIAEHLRLRKELALMNIIEVGEEEQEFQRKYETPWEPPAIPEELLPGYQQQHSFHILESSILPFITAFFTFDILFFFVHYLHYDFTSNSQHHIFISIFFLLLTLTL